VHTGMVGSEIQEHKLAVVAFALHAPFLGDKAECLLLELKFVLIDGVGVHLGGPRRVLLAQRVPSPGGRQQNTTEIGMTIKGHAKHVPGFALVPVGNRPDVGDARAMRRVALQRHLQANIAIEPERHEVVDHREISRGLSVAMLAQPLVDRKQIVQKRILGLQQRHRLAQMLGGYPKSRYSVGNRLLRNGILGDELGHMLGLYRSIHWCRTVHRLSGLRGLSRQRASNLSALLRRAQVCRPVSIQLQ